MPSSLIKFSNRRGSGSDRLFWDRADIDGAPFRGAQAPLMREEEYENRVVRVADTRNGFFDVTDPEQNEKYLEILDCCFNQWFKLVHLERFWNGTTSHYLEWIEVFMEDGSRTPFQHGSMIELVPGQQTHT